jgi:hypothetical protein
MTDKAASHEEIERLLGAIDAHKVVEIMESGATVAELEEVAAHLALETDVMGEQARPLTGRARMIYELVRRDEETMEEDR